MRSLRGLIIAVVAIGIAVAALSSFGSQPAPKAEPVTITLSVSNLSGSVFNDKLINAFETAHPGIKVTVVKTEARIPAAALGLDKHFAATQQYANAADVLYVTNTDIVGADTATISVDATRAGYFLDLKPFVGEDKTLNIPDFFPSIWQSYQWDNGIWALPYAADPFILSYSPSAFDKANLAYPNENWTLDDFSNAVERLAVKDASGKVTEPGLDVYAAQYSNLMRGLLTTSLLDTSIIPNTPKFDTQEVATLLQAWLKLDQAGMISADFNKAPLSLMPAFMYILRPNSSDPRVATLLPGGRTTLGVQGFAVSGGTQYPQEAYALAKWLTTRGEVAKTTMSSTPARKSLLNTSGDTSSYTLNISADLQAVINKAIDNALPLAEMRYVDYLAGAYNNVKVNNADIRVALQAAEDQALKNQRAAAARKEKPSVVIATPAPSQTLAPGKIALKVGVISYSMTNQAQWDKLISDFTATDPEVSKVIFEKFIDVNVLNQLGPALVKYDCVYAPFNGVSATELPRLLNLDPFLAADPTFDKKNMVGGTLAQVTLDNKIWMLPTDLAPNVLRYDSERFEKSGVPLPGTLWTTDQFVDALKTLKSDSTGQPGFAPLNTYGAYLFQLIAAYGGNPIDYRTNPPTINFSDPATVDAVQQVLNLAKDGYIKYRPLFSNRLDISFKPDPSTIWQTTFTAYSLPIPEAGMPNNKTKITLYPKGSKYAAVTYNLGGFYISATSQNPAACYRLISKAARMPTLFAAMPARRTLFDDPILIASQGADAVAVYKQIATLLDDPNTLVFPGITVGSDRVPVQMHLELFAAFDKALLFNADLKGALKDAEISAKAFQECTAGLPPLDVSVDKQRAYINGFIDCALKADPAMAPLYSGLKTN